MGVVLGSRFLSRLRGLECLCQSQRLGLRCQHWRHRSPGPPSLIYSTWLPWPGPMATVEVPTGVQTAMAPDWGRLIMTISSCIYWALPVIRFSAKSPLSLASCPPLTLGADDSSGCMAMASTWNAGLWPLTDTGPAVRFVC